ASRIPTLSLSLPSTEGLMNPSASQGLEVRVCVPRRARPGFHGSSIGCRGACAMHVLNGEGASRCGQYGLLDPRLAVQPTAQLLASNRAITPVLDSPAQAHQMCGKRLG